ncbi:MAG: flagellar basal body-associated FliL family protein [Thermoanaerobaculia bacterium]
MDSPPSSPQRPEEFGTIATLEKPSPPAAVILFAELPNLEARARANAENANRLASLLQQIVGESVYLYDGTVVDPFGKRVLAQLPDCEKGIQAVLKARSDLRDYNKAHPGMEHLIDARIVLHAGDAKVDGNTLTGPAATEGFAALAAMRPLDVGVSEIIIRNHAKPLKTRPLGTLAGLQMFEVSGYERPTVAVPAPAPAGARPAHEKTPREEGAAEPSAPAAKKKLPVVPIAAGVVLLLAVAGAAGFMMLRHGKPEATTIVQAPAVPQLDPNLRRRIIVEPFDIESANPDVQSQTSAIRYATIASLRAIPQIEISEGGQSDGRVTAVVRDGGAGPELVPTLHIAGSKVEGAPVLLANPQIATTDLVRWALKSLSVPGGKFVTANPAAFGHFLEALVATSGRPGREENAKAAASLSMALQEDPSFLPAHFFAFDFYRAAGNLEAARASGRAVREFEPNHSGMIRELAKIEFGTGNPAGGLNALRAIMERDPEDRDVLLAIARHSVSVGDKEVFAKAAAKLREPDPATVPVHDADLALAAGRIESAIGRYYDLEVEQPQNPALALKIGRIAVLRRSVEIAELELGKLEKLDPDYGYLVLKAYVEAQGGNADAAHSLIEKALANARWMDDPHTAAAEVHAILGENDAVVTSLDKAVAASEPTIGYIVANPLFTYMTNDPVFAGIRERIDAQRAAVSAELRKMPL